MACFLEYRFVVVDMLHRLGFVFMVCNAMVALYKGGQNFDFYYYWTIFFVFSAFVNLLLLYWCFRTLEGLLELPNCPERKSLIEAMWTLIFSLSISSANWYVAHTSICFGCVAVLLNFSVFYRLFLRPSEELLVQPSAETAPEVDIAVP